MGHRKRFFDDALQSHLDELDQLVILGAGRHTRAYSLAQREGIRVFENDAPDTQLPRRIGRQESFGSLMIASAASIPLLNDPSTEARFK